MDEVSKGLVLVAEDDPDQSELLLGILSDEGYRVLHAENSLQVVRYLSERPDVILLDLVGVSSPAVFHAVGNMRSPPALVLISADPLLPEAALKLGADAFLPKPYEMSELLMVLDACVQGKKIASTALSLAKA
jgi:DNA-binding response OmpR family regulator